MAKAAKVKAFRKEEVQDYNKALKETDTTLGAIKAKLEEDEGIFANWFGSEEDVSGVFTALGLGVGDVAELIAGGTTKIDAWAAALRAAGVDSDGVAIAAGVLKQNVEDLAAAQDNAAISAQFLKDTTDGQTASWDAAKDSVKELAAGLDGSADSARNVTARTRDLADGLGEARDAADDLRHANEQLRGDLSQQEAYLNLQAQFDETKRKGTEAMEAVASKSKDADSKMRDYELSVIDSKTAVMDFNDEWGNVTLDQQLTMNAKVERGQFDDLIVDVGKATSTVRWIDVRVRTTVDQAWERVMGSRI
jgi:methyl-accepting chemotaxis protein